MGRPDRCALEAQRGQWGRRVPRGLVARGQSSGHWVIKCGPWQREGGTACFSGGRDPGRAGRGPRAEGGGWEWGAPAGSGRGDATGNRRLAQPDPGEGRGGQWRRRRERRGPGGVASPRRAAPRRNLALSGLREPRRRKQRQAGGEHHAPGPRSPGRERPRPRRSRLAVPGRTCRASGRGRRAGRPGSPGPGGAGAPPAGGRLGMAAPGGAQA